MKISTQLSKLGQYFLANNKQTAIWALVATLLILVSLPGSFIAASIIGFITLCSGGKAGFKILLAALLPILLAMMVWRDAIVIYLAMILLRYFLIWIFSLVLKHSASWCLLLELMTIFGIVVVVGTHVLVPHVSTEWWPAFLNAHIEELNSVLWGQFSNEQLKTFIIKIAPMATGILSVSMISIVFIQLLLIRAWQALVFQPGGLHSEFIEIRLKPLMAVILTLIVLGQWFQLSFMIDLLPVVVFPFIIVGISLVHKLVEQKKQFRLSLLIVYLGLFFLPQLMFIILAFAGYADSWYDLRKRIIPRKV